jgi:hypothetical protein
MAAHLLLCSNKDRTQLLINNTDELGKWLERDDIMDPELAYWIPKYILMRGDKPFADMGVMSPGMKALAQSQDNIGYHNFMEGYIYSLLRNSELPLSHVQQLSQRCQLGKAIHLKTPSRHALSMDPLQHISPQQDQWVPPQEEVRRDSAQARVTGRDSS